MWDVALDQAQGLRSIRRQALNRVAGPLVGSHDRPRRPPPSRAPVALERGTESDPSNVRTSLRLLV
jgi:hypothetical protein